jgi:hypothetical protein
MAETERTQISFYKDGDWNTLNQHVFMCFNLNLINLSTSSSSNEIKSAFRTGYDFGTIFELLTPFNVILIQNGPSTIVPSQVSRTGSPTNGTFSIVFRYWTAPTQLITYCIIINNSSGNLSVTTFKKITQNI